MTDYKQERERLSKLYNTTDEVITIPESNVVIRNYRYTSTFPVEYQDSGVVRGDLYYFELAQGGKDENRNFVYPVVAPLGEEQFDKAVIFFHGLNERAWDKYLPWAKFLAEKSGRPVIMFPIAYHINRSPKSWSNPRNMREVVHSRNSDTEGATSTFANAALSTRLEKNPERFLISGIQSYYDVLDIVGGIKAGRHPLFHKGAHVDIFAYSIGCFLAEILLLNNSEDIFRDSRLAMFCGGGTFDSMYGISKYIMDERAYQSIMSLNSGKKLREMGRHFVGAPKWMRFRRNWDAIGLMMNDGERRSEREKLLSRNAHNIYAIALEGDKVMPFRKIVRTLKGRKGDIPTRVEVIDFPFDYSHEIPFPTSEEGQMPLVNRAFNLVFNNIVNFYLIGDSVRERAERYRHEKAERAEREEREERAKAERIRAEKEQKREVKVQQKADRRAEKEQRRAEKRAAREQKRAEKRATREQRKAEKAQKREAKKAARAAKKDK